MAERRAGQWKPVDQDRIELVRSFVRGRINLPPRIVEDLLIEIEALRTERDTFADRLNVLDNEALERSRE